MRIPSFRKARLAVSIVAIAGFSLASSGFTQEYQSPEIVVGPLPYLGVHGVGISPEGHLLAGSVVGQSLSRVDKESGEVSTVVGPPEGMADDIAFGPQGQPTWTSFLEGKLRIRQGDGTVKVLAKNLPSRQPATSRWLKRAHSE